LGAYSATSKGRGGEEKGNKGIGKGRGGEGMEEKGDGMEGEERGEKESINPPSIPAYAPEL